MSRIALMILLIAASAFSQTDPFPRVTILDHASDLADVVAGDVNGDGLPDLVTPSPATGEVVVWIASPGGSYTPTVFPAVATARVVLLEDFDGDGDLDIVVGGTRVRMLAGDGAGSFAAPVTIGALQQNYRLLRSRDLDGDGSLDIFALGNLAIVLVHRGPGGFTETTFAVDTFSGAAAGDFDGDGAQDIATIRLAPGPVAVYEVHRGDGAGGFLPPNPVPGLTTEFFRHASAADLDGDGDDDLLLSGIEFRTFLGGPGGLQPGATLPVHLPPLAAPLLTDFDQDGDVDLIAKTGTAVGVVTGYPGDGAGGFDDTIFSLGTIRSLQSPDDAPQLAVVDLGGDGLLDLVVCSGDLELLGGTGGGEFGPVRTGLVPGLGVFDGVSADFDGDGNLDLAVVGISNSMSGVAVLLGDGQGRLGAATIIPQNVNFPGELAVADFDGDGLPDLVLADGQPSAPAFWIFLSDGDGTFTVAPPPLADRATSLDVGDFDGDGIQDVVAVISDSTARRYDGSGGGVFTFGSTFGLPMGTRQLSAGHLDDDGNLDVVASRYAHVDIVHGLGGGVFSAPVSILVGDRFLLAPLITDVDLDGNTDILAHDPQGNVSGFNGELLVLLGLAGGGFQAPAVVPASEVSQVALTNLDGDGVPEIGFVRQLTGTSSSRFTPPASLTEVASTPFGVHFQVPGDFDGDGIEDLVVDHFGLLAILPSSPSPERRGTLEDLLLESTLGFDAPDAFPVEVGRDLDPVELVVTSPRGDFVGEPLDLWLQLFATGDAPAAVPGIPTIHLDFTTPIPPILSLTVPSLPPGGATLAGSVPPGSAGVSVFVQGIALSAAAGNGIFAATDLHELRLNARPAPTITDVTPLHPGPGENVVLSGAGFVAGATLIVDGVSVPYSNLTAARITFAAPPNLPCNALVEVVNGDGQSASASWNPDVAITFVLPNTMITPGLPVLVVGSFGTANTATVTLDGVPVTTTGQSTSFIQFTAPPHPTGPAILRVAAPSGCHDEATIIYATVDPTINLITPEVVSGGETVLISGSSFFPNVTLTVGGTAVPVATSSSALISFVAPMAVPCDTDVVVSNPGGGTDSAPWNPAPVITDIQPDSLDHVTGGQVTLSGSFSSLDVFDVGGLPVTPVSIGATTTLLTIPPGPVGPTTVTVTRTNGCTDSVAFAYVLGAPLIHGVLPAHAASGATVTITGVQFQSGLTLDVGGGAVVPTSVTSTTVTFVVPAGVQCGPDLTITNPDGLSATAAFNAPPRIISATPASGPSTGGNHVTISGSGFVAGSSVLFGQTPAAQIVLATPGLYIAVPPPGLPGEVGVRIVSPMGCIDDAPYEYLP